MIAASPPNKKGGYSARLSQNEKTDSSPLIQQLRFVKRLDLVSWQRRVDNILAEFIRTGNQKHLTAVHNALAGIQQRLTGP
jgi:hypothetical protein